MENIFEDKEKDILRNILEKKIFSLYVKFNQKFWAPKPIKDKILEEIRATENIIEKTLGEKKCIRIIEKYQVKAIKETSCKKCDASGGLSSNDVQPTEEGLLCKNCREKLGYKIEGITFKNILEMIPGKQIELAEKLNINRSTITDYKAGRAIPSLRILSKMVKLYPDLPWIKYIKNIEKELDSNER
ncbi:MAG: helix-turn-helix domain-containing protein [archaeon]